MIETIQNALQKAGVSVWRITGTHSRAAELYLIRKGLDMPRVKDMVAYSVDVFRDFEEDGRRFRGVSTALLSPGMSGAQAEKKIADAYSAAAYVKNPFYELPDAVTGPRVASGSDLAALDPQRAARRLADALLEADTEKDAFLNSAELFVTRREVRILASNGLDVSYDSDEVWGELVAQCTAPRDVEQYRSFRLDSLDTAAAAAKLRAAVRDVRQRALAQKAPAAGTYDLLLTGEHLSEILSYYVDRSNAAAIFPRYSAWSVGTEVQGEDVTGERLELSLSSSVPYSEEGIPLPDRTLVSDGRLQLIHGATRFCRYLGVEPTGAYRKLRCGNGTVPIDQLRRPGVLEAVSFSDFQMDSFSGHFGGEIRLALLHGEQELTPLSGGSVNGSLLETQGRLIFSREQIRDGSYEGPMAVLIPGVPVAGE